MNVNQLNRDQLEELAARHLMEHYHEYNPDAEELEGPSYGEVADALDIVGRDTLMTEYADIEFSCDDFFCSAQLPKARRESYTYEIRQVDAWMYDGDWTYNDSWHLDTFTTTGDVPRAFRRALARLGVTFYRGRTVTEYDGGIYEIVDRATREPLFAAIPQEV